MRLFKRTHYRTTTATRWDLVTNRKECFSVSDKTENVVARGGHLFILMTGSVAHESKAGFPMRHVQRTGSGEVAGSQEL